MVVVSQCYQRQVYCGMGWNQDGIIRIVYADPNVILGKWMSRKRRTITEMCMHVISQWGTQKISCHIINSVLSYLSYALLLLPAVRVGEMSNISTTLVFLIIGPNVYSPFLPGLGLLSCTKVLHYFCLDYHIQLHQTLPKLLFDA